MKLKPFKHEYFTSPARKKLTEENLSKINFGKGLELQIRSLEKRKSPKMLPIENKINYQILKKIPSFSRKAEEVDPSEITTIKGRMYLKLLDGNLEPEEKLINAVRTHSQLKIQTSDINTDTNKLYKTPKNILYSTKGQNNSKLLGFNQDSFHSTRGKHRKSDFFESELQKVQNINKHIAMTNKHNISMFDMDINKLSTLNKSRNRGTPYQTQGIKSTKTQIFENYENYMAIGRNNPNKEKVFSDLKRFYQMDSEYINSPKVNSRNISDLGKMKGNHTVEQLATDVFDIQERDLYLNTHINSNVESKETKNQRNTRSISMSPKSPILLTSPSDQGTGTQSFIFQRRGGGGKFYSPRRESPTSCRSHDHKIDLPGFKYRPLIPISRAATQRIDFSPKGKTASKYIISNNKPMKNGRISRNLSISMEKYSPKSYITLNKEGKISSPDEEREQEKLELSNIVNKYQKDEGEIQDVIESDELFNRMNNLLNIDKESSTPLKSQLALREAGYRKELHNIGANLTNSIRKTKSELTKKIKLKLREDELVKGRTYNFRPQPPKEPKLRKITTRTDSKKSLDKFDLFNIERRGRFHTVANRKASIPKDVLEFRKYHNTVVQEKRTFDEPTETLSRIGGGRRKTAVEMLRNQFHKVIERQRSTPRITKNKTPKLINVVSKVLNILDKVTEEEQNIIEGELIPGAVKCKLRTYKQRERKITRKLTEESEDFGDSDEEISLLKKFNAKEEKEKMSIQRKEKYKQEELQMLLTDYALEYKDDPIYATAVEKLNQKTQIMNQYRKITNPFNIDSAEGLNEEFLRECQKVNAVPLPILSMIKSQKLELNCSLTPNISQSISNMCPKFSNCITQINLNNNGLNDESFSRILKGFMQNPKITELIYENNTIGIESTKLLKELIRRPSPDNMKNIQLRKCRIPINLTNIILASVSKNRVLNKFALTNNTLDDLNIEYLANLVKQNRKLYYLDIGQNDISHKNIQNFLKALMKNKSIQHLNIENWSLGSESVINERDKEKTKIHLNIISFLSTFFAKNKRLVHINLSYTRLVDGDIFQWLKTFQHSKSINVIHLSGNCISDRCREHIRQYLDVNLVADRVQSKIYQLTTNQEGEQALKDLRDAVESTKHFPGSHSKNTKFFKSVPQNTNYNKSGKMARGGLYGGHKHRERKELIPNELNVPNEVGMHRNRSVVNLEDLYILSRITEHPEIRGADQWKETSTCWICENWTYIISIFAYDPAYKRLDKIQEDSLGLTQHINEEIVNKMPYLALNNTDYSPVPMHTCSDFINLLTRGSCHVEDSKFRKLNSHTVFQFILDHAKIIPLFSPEESVLKSSGKSKILYLAGNYFPPGMMRGIFIFKGSEKRLSGMAEKTLQFYEMKMNIDPLTQDILCTYIPQEGERIRKFRKPKSLFRDYKESTPILLKKSLEFDVKTSKILRFLKTEEELEKIFNILLNNLLYLRDIFIYCIAISSYPNISWIDFTNNCYEMKIIDKNMTISTIDRLFIAVNVYLGKLEDNPDRDLCRYEFYEILVRIASTKYKDTKIVTTHSMALNMLIEQIKLHSVIKFDGYQFKAEQLWNLEVDDLFKGNQKALRTIFDKYATRKFLTVQDAIKIIKTSQLNIPERNIILAYAFSKQIIINEMEEITFYQKMSFPEFLEFLGRVTYKIFERTEDHKLPLAEKLKKSLQNILNVSPGLTLSEAFAPGSDEDFDSDSDS